LASRQKPVKNSRQLLYGFFIFSLKNASSGVVLTEYRVMLNEYPATRLSASPCQAAAGYKEERRQESEEKNRRRQKGADS
jgi:hypothetical protein